MTIWHNGRPMQLDDMPEFVGPTPRGIRRQLGRKRTKGAGWDLANKNRRWQEARAAFKANPPKEFGSVTTVRGFLMAPEGYEAEPGGPMSIGEPRP